MKKEGQDTDGLHWYGMIKKATAITKDPPDGAQAMVRLLAERNLRQAFPTILR